MPIQIQMPLLSCCSSLAVIDSSPDAVGVHMFGRMTARLASRENEHTLLTPRFPILGALQGPSKRIEVDFQRHTYQRTTHL